MQGGTPSRIPALGSTAFAPIVSYPEVGSWAAADRWQPVVQGEDAAGSYRA
jgi:hypothetical protein